MDATVTSFVSRVGGHEPGYDEGVEDCRARVGFAEDCGRTRNEAVRKGRAEIARCGVVSDCNMSVFDIMGEI